jgi:hypothetical protein
MELFEKCQVIFEYRYNYELNSTVEYKIMPHEFMDARVVCRESSEKKQTHPSDTKMMFTRVIPAAICMRMHHIP